MKNPAIIIIIIIIMIINYYYQIEGTIEFSETRFQPFMKRAGGIWGDRVECLPR